MNKPWSREETIIAFNVYCKIPFNCSSKTNPTIIKYANIIGRSPSALNMKIGNIGRLDPDLKIKGISGLTHGAQMEEEVWNEFYRNPESLAFESERLIAQFANKNIEEISSIRIDDLPQGVERETIIKQRVNQSFFRATVMSAYNFRCCISGVGNPELLEACHISEWSQDPVNRLNPKNGICMNTFFHKAYDKYLMSITPDFDIIISDRLLDNVMEQHFKDYLMTLRGHKITMPEKFTPQKDFLEIHYHQFKTNAWI
ncbi:MAG: HNH endonuclease [Bacteroidales bacterium]|nr:HNH endonuclease [Bacteroidales bacterium]